jgi:hypothetical protein
VPRSLTIFGGKIMRTKNILKTEKMQLPRKKKRTQCEANPNRRFRENFQLFVPIPGQERFSQRRTRYAPEQPIFIN